jgi:hypothetical protein
MPDISMYLDHADLALLEQFLNDDDQIIYVVKTGESQVQTLKSQTLPPSMKTYESQFQTFKSLTLQPFMHCTLWHLPCGEIPADCRDSQGRITIDPYIKHLGAIGLDLQVRPGICQTFVPRPNGVGHELSTFESEIAIGRSDFGWVGNKYSIIGKKANPETERWWKHLRRWVSKHATKVTWDDTTDLDARAWAFPAAYSAIKSGTPRNVNPVRLQDRSKPAVIQGPNEPYLA